MIDVCVRLDWRTAGAVTLQAGSLVFPTPPSAPGLYRFDLRNPEGSARVYVGQTDGLPRRFGQYRNPGSKQQTNIRINAILVDALGKGLTVEASVAVAGEFSVAGQTAALDFKKKAHRLLAEGAAVVATGAEDVILDNL